jgi:hypothetical protein
MSHRTARGVISYLGPDGAERGREWFHVTSAVDGSRTMRTVSEIDDSQILRDVTLTVGPDWRPRDSYVRVCVADELVGSGWFEFTETQARAEVLSVQLGRISQILPSAGRAPMFGAHQLAGDGWQAGLLDGHGAGPLRVEGVLLSSPEPNGSSGPLLATISLTAERIGPERITVPAGTFDTVHYRFSPDGLDPEDVWVLEGSNTLVRSSWPHYGTSYELSSYEER